MDSSLTQTLTRLPRLDSRHRIAEARTCKLCRGLAPFCDVVDLNKICSKADPYVFGSSGVSVAYFQCMHCGFVFTEFFDNWSSAEFSKFIYNEDYVKVDGAYVSVRPMAMANQAGRLLKGHEGARILDYGSGSGVFTREMRAKGFTAVQDYDPFSNPQRPSGLFDFITCFEVIEHAPDPVGLLADVVSLMAPGGSFLFSQALQPDNFADLRGAWWYMAPRNGHVSLYSANALSVLADTAGLRLYKGQGLYAFSIDTPSDASREVLARFALPYRFLKLYAPDATHHCDGGRPTWHGVEGAGPHRFRWAGVDRIDWPIPCPPAGALVRVEIPFVNQVEADYAKRARVQLGETVVDAHIEGSVLWAEFCVVAAAAAVVTLLTPAPRSPAVMRGAADQRFLGLAVSLQPHASPGSNSGSGPR